MKPLRHSVKLALAITFAIAGAATFAQEKDKATAVEITRGPYLQDVTPTSFTVLWTTKAPAPSVVHYAIGHDSWAGEQKVVEGVASVVTHVVTITAKLQPGSYGEYAIGDPKAPRHAFHTAPGPDCPTFTALVFGDSGDGSKHQLELAKKMEQEKFDFILHTGDVVYPNGEDSDYNEHYFAPYKSLLESHCVFPAIGNHDLRYSKDQKAEGYRHAFVTPANNPDKSPFYYSFEWGDAKFVSIESDILFQKPGPHLAWLEQELASNKRRWLVVFMHVPLYSPGHHKDSPALQQTVGPLLEKYQVDLVLAGHEHCYERLGPTKKSSTDPKWAGWPSILTGGGGAHLDKIQTKHENTIKAESCFHYVLLEFTHTAIKGKTVRVDGTLADEFTLEHK